MKPPAPRPDLVWFPGGAVALGTSRSAARASYSECVSQGACAMSFAESPFADEVGEARAHLGPFWLARTEVTNQEYAQFLSERRAELESTFASPEQASLRDRAGHLWAFLGRAGTQATLPLVLHDEGQVALADLTRARDPITHVTWFGAVAFCAARGGRLPSEAEWALAAQGEARTFPWGEAELQDCRGASFGRNSERECGALGASPMPVATGTRDISPEGVYDLGGNVSEWTSTVFDVHAPARYRAGCSSAQKEAGSCRVVRGGSYWDARIFLRGATRSALDVSAFWRALGFRCAFEETR